MSFKMWGYFFVAGPSVSKPVTEAPHVRHDFDLMNRIPNIRLVYSEL